jgi:hypothetical protein
VATGGDDGHQFAVGGWWSESNSTTCMGVTRTAHAQANRAIPRPPSPRCLNPMQRDEYDHAAHHGAGVPAKQAHHQGRNCTDVGRAGLYVLVSGQCRWFLPPLAAARRSRTDETTFADSAARILDEFLERFRSADGVRLGSKFCCYVTLGVAWTLADLAGRTTAGLDQVAAALSFRQPGASR